MSRFLHVVPYTTGRSLAAAYNEVVEKADQSFDWILITDADVMFLTPTYGHLIQEAIDKHPDAGILTCLTNRIGATSQLTKDGKMGSADLLHLRNVALERYKQYGSTITRIRPPVSGFFMLFPRIAWKRVGGFRGSGRLGIDWDFSYRISAAGLPIYRMEGLFVAHFYRLDGRSAS